MLLFVEKILQKIIPEKLNWRLILLTTLYLIYFDVGGLKNSFIEITSTFNSPMIPKLFAFANVVLKSLSPWVVALYLVTFVLPFVRFNRYHPNMKFFSDYTKNQKNNDWHWSALFGQDTIWNFTNKLVQNYWLLYFTLGTFTNQLYKLKTYSAEDPSWEYICFIILFWSNLFFLGVTIIKSTFYMPPLDFINVGFFFKKSELPGFNCIISKEFFNDTTDSKKNPQKGIYIFKEKAKRNGCFRYILTTADLYRDVFKEYPKTALGDSSNAEQNGYWQSEVIPILQLEYKVIAIYESLPEAKIHFDSLVLHYNSNDKSRDLI